MPLCSVSPQHSRAAETDSLGYIEDLAALPLSLPTYRTTSEVLVGRLCLDLPKDGKPPTGTALYQQPRTHLHQ